ncbi:MAG: DUF302 domain-containing protein [Bacteroidales bacterium]|jgi:uncharacterized protein (DUF302 family)|nr:DUF302 domain-containing protein [Bacteroidales bacterium]
MKSLFMTTLIVFVLVTSCTQPAEKEEKIQTQLTQNNEPMFLENESKYNFAETVEMLIAKIEKEDWKVSTVHNLQESLEKNGTEVLPIKVFALCNPKHSSKILLKDDERIVSSLMPCRVSVYEKSNGKTYISRMNTGILAKSLGGVVEEVMVASSKDVEEILSPLIAAE